MGDKLPSFQFYPADWTKDPALSLCSPSTRGIWIDFLCAMHQFDRCGVIAGTLDQLARLGRCSTVELDHAISELQLTQTADVTVRHEIITLMNRRMSREYKRRKADALRQKKRRCHAGVAGKSPPYSSSSSSSSEKRKQEERTPPSPSAAKPRQPDSAFDRFWLAYPRKVKKPDALRAWQKINPDLALAEKIISAVAIQKAWPDWTKDGGHFIPYPASWLNAEGWNNQLPEVAQKSESLSNYSNDSWKYENMSHEVRCETPGTPEWRALNPEKAKKWDGTAKVIDATG